MVYAYMGVWGFRLDGCAEGTGGVPGVVISGGGDIVWLQVVIDPEKTVDPRVDKHKYLWRTGGAWSEVEWHSMPMV